MRDWRGKRICWQLVHAGEHKRVQSRRDGKGQRDIGVRLRMGLWLAPALPASERGIRGKWATPSMLLREFEQDSVVG